VRHFRSELGPRLGHAGAVGLVADYSLSGIAALLALWAERCCVALLPQGSQEDETYHSAAHLANVVGIGEDGAHEILPAGGGGTHPLLEKLRARAHPGMILFTSGSSGEPKAVLHDVNRFLLKFSKPGKRLSTYAFLVFDHVAGQDTLLYTLSAGGDLVTGQSRRPDVVAALIEKYSVQVLPASPTFLNLLLLSGAAEKYDLGSVEIITYGSEPIDEGTLRRLAGVFPNSRIIQKYGTSEFGAIRSISRSNDSTYIQIKKDETDYRVLDGVLWVKSRGAMLGYLNAPSGLDEEGWLCTGDLVEQDGDWLRILGRESDLINVGGEKVVPAEVEAVVNGLDFVRDCTVKGERQPIVGMAVVCEVAVDQEILDAPPADRRKLTKAIRQKCRDELAAYKVPVRVDFVARPVVTERQKKIRRS
jgi:long-chain acyl-CoA synthetase